ncbi:MAG: putative UDP-glucuronic acid epimerase [Bacteroidetes bacterium]|nr:putative UDP-glucuronic acid epimerase [Bacteroidota bacterium]
MRKILVTGVAGFIGHSFVKQLLLRGDAVIGIDNINSYYDVNLKYARLADLGVTREEIAEDVAVGSKIYRAFRFIKTDLQRKTIINRLFADEHFDAVCNLAAQAGVRYSIDHPFEYINSNIVGFMHLLEACRQHKIDHFVYASSSSVYGNDNAVPYSEKDEADHPVSLYAATKKSDELLAYSYSQLYGLPATGVRFFTVYGPWGRPDMAPYLFMDAVLSDKPIKVFNYGNLERDFTYVDDVVNCLIRIIDSPAEGKVPYEIYNIGNSSPVRLMDFIETIERTTGKTAIKEFVGMQPGDVLRTCADMSRFEERFGPGRFVTIDHGIAKMYQWFVAYRSRRNKTTTVERCDMTK